MCEYARSTPLKENSTPPDRLAAHLLHSCPPSLWLPPPCAECVGIHSAAQALEAKSIEWMDRQHELSQQASLSLQLPLGKRLSYPVLSFVQHGESRRHVAALRVRNRLGCALVQVEDWRTSTYAVRPSSHCVLNCSFLPHAAHAMGCVCAAAQQQLAKFVSAAFAPTVAFASLQVCA